MLDETVSAKYWKDPDPDYVSAMKAKLAGAGLVEAKGAREANQSKAMKLVIAAWFAFGSVIALGITLVMVLV